MNEMRLEPPTSDRPPPEPPPTSTPDEAVSAASGKGSMVLGFVLAWMIVVGGYFLIMALNLLNNFLLPQAALVVVGIVFAVNGKSRTAAGIFLGLGSMLAVVLLLVAACFGLVSNGSFWH